MVEDDLDERFVKEEDRLCCLQNPNHMYAIDCNYLLLYAADRENVLKTFANIKGPILEQHGCNAHPVGNGAIAVA